MKPQLDEIKEALSKATPGRDYEFGSRDKITANAPQWLTFLLEENERIIKERDERETKYHVDMNNFRSQVQTWQESHDREVISLRAELAVKNKGLAFYADEATYDIDHLDKYGYIIIDRDAGEQARSILSQYATINESTEEP